MQLDYIEPGKPIQNGHVKSVNGKFRDEYLNTHGKPKVSSKAGGRTTTKVDHIVS